MPAFIVEATLTPFHNKSYGPFSDRDVAERFAESVRTDKVQAFITELVEPEFDKFFVVRSTDGLFWQHDQGWVENVGDATLYNQFGRTHYQLPMGGAWEPAPRFNHAYSIAFSLVSNHPEGKDVKPLQFRKALMKRMADLDRAGEWEEALGAPYDTYEEEPE